MMKFTETCRRSKEIRRNWTKVPEGEVFRASLLKHEDNYDVYSLSMGGVFMQVY